MFSPRVLLLSKPPATVIDHDIVKLHNLDRSPVFVERDIRRPKVEAARDYLQSVGLQQLKIDPHALHESPLWHARQAGTPDLIIAAANEKKVRYYIEAGFPPLQLYATTGQNWQVALLRHEPFGNTCSLCLFPADEIAAPTACATARAKPGPPEGDEQVDAALPFLSFAAGLMTAAESVKRVTPGFPFNANRVILSTRPGPQLMWARLSHREGCFCETRDTDIYRRMVIKP